ncbi:hypothetical protein M0R72_05195 [Candidatus Pacearchaeota archaeon]|jgi:hypothetical protein|nr:hypothetical protein [Candidatus Pacearchaeota archaeon]
MKRGKIIFKFSNRVLYSLITLGILIAVGVGVYAATYTATGAGHPYTEISTCGANQILRMNAAGTSWECVSMGYEIVYGEVVEKGTSIQAKVYCPAGKIVIGGGCEVHWNYPYPESMAKSVPFTNGTSSGWICNSNPVTRYGEYTEDKSIYPKIRAYAICINTQYPITVTIPGSDGITVSTYSSDGKHTTTVY